METSSIHPREFTMSKNMVGEKYYSNADKKSVKMWNQYAKLLHIQSAMNQQFRAFKKEKLGWCPGILR